MAASEQRSFRMHPDLLYSVIKNQAGTIAKAVLELVMNSIDAGATKVDIIMDRTTLKVSDDGKGFRSEQEIQDWFETFGTPHKEGDAVYGRFRMGRGQVMAHGRNVWRSGEFRMSVDVKDKGLDYTLDKGLNLAPGCVIEEEMYAPLSPSDLVVTENTLTEQCKYAPIPVFFNGEKLNVDIDSVKWTEVTEDAFIKIAPQSNHLSIYNLGVLVCHEYTHSHGVGGIIVSRKALEVNFARNDVIKGQCNVWKRIKPILQRYAEKPETEKREKRTDEWREYMAKEMLAWDGSSEKGRTLYEALIFTDVVGKHWSMRKLCDRRQKAITLGMSGDHKADLIQQMGTALVLDQTKTEALFHPQTLERGMTRLKGMLGKQQCQYWALVNAADSLLTALTPFDVIAAGIANDHIPLAEKDISKPAVVVLAVLNSLQSQFAANLNWALGTRDFSRRTFYAMRSQTAEAYTDGSKSIYLHEDFLTSKKGPSMGMDWAAKIVPLTVHEYLHNFNSGVGHTHDAEFYEMFHRAMQSPRIAEMHRHVFNAYVGAIKRLPQPVLRQMDRIAVAQDRASAESAAFAEAVAGAPGPQAPVTTAPVRAKKPRLSRMALAVAAGQMVLVFPDKTTKTRQNSAAQGSRAKPRKTALKAAA
jgi:hypothetical protein